jgi:5-methylcytosine-specific restriction enzyme B
MNNETEIVNQLKARLQEAPQGNELPDPTARRFWVEKTHVQNRLDRLQGDHALGEALWSPQTSTDGRKIYELMLEAKPGDVVFHLIDDEKIEGYSEIVSPADTSFIGLAGTDWADFKCYRIQLTGHTTLEPEIDRSDFLKNANYRPILQELLDEDLHVFYNRNFNLNQGKYLTEAPLKLVQIWNDIQIRRSGQPINPKWNIPPLDGGSPAPIANMPTPEEFLSAAETTILETGFQHPPGLVRRFLAALEAKPFVILTGNSGTGKTKLAELFAQWLSGEDRNRLALIPVGADWTDNRNVLGFVNHIRTVKLAGETVDVPVYQSTGILDLLLAADTQRNKPFFLILDEMNLSHVERYFADFLSAIESLKGELLLHSEGRMLPRKPGHPADVPEKLPLPRNVFVIGTVNVDETTYMFSPKVLDRANVIEFRVDAGAPGKFLASGGKPIAAITAAPAGYAEAFLELSIRARCAPDSTPLTLAATPPPEAKIALEKCRTVVEDLFALMQKCHQEFAFRSMAEILRFLAVDYELTTDKANWKWLDAVDAQILQKILPKLHGSKRKLGALLAALATYCEAGKKEDAEASFDKQAAIESYAAEGDKICKEPFFKDSHRKLCEMILTVRRDQFVSFIQ